MGDDEMEGACAPLACSLRAACCALALSTAPCTDYGFEYSDDEPEEEDVDIENQYYNAKGARRRRPLTAARRNPQRALLPAASLSRARASPRRAVIRGWTALRLVASLAVTAPC
jgi:hypothetical protein